jgi:hypothetical protein
MCNIRQPEVEFEDRQRSADHRFINAGLAQFFTLAFHKMREVSWPVEWHPLRKDSAPLSCGINKGISLMN